MECATLFCIGTLRNIRTAGVAAVDGSPFKWEKDGYDPRAEVVTNAKKHMLTSALKTCKKAAQEIAFN